MSDTLFDPPEESEEYFIADASAPLAARMRPQSLDEIQGQEHVLGPGTPLRRLIEGQGAASVVLYGPPGTGKTTIASLISRAAAEKFVALSALSAGVKEVRAVISQAKQDLVHGRRTVLFIDEVHRFSKTQQDALLHAVEHRIVILVAATTENPSFSVVAPLLSRSVVVQLESLNPEAMAAVIDRAISSDQGLAGQVAISEAAREHLVLLAGGDARRALTYLEAAAEAVPPGGTIEIADFDKTIDKAVVRYDRDGDQHYDIISAFIKSIRGSDPDAALHYLARMIAAGEDPRFIVRRLMVHASEDIGLADPTALTAAVNAAEVVDRVGMPEARLALAQATIHLATAPKSNSVYEAISGALADVNRGIMPPVPTHLRDGHYEGAKALGHAVGYQYPHDDPRGVLPQRYIPEGLEEASYYQPTTHGAERRLAEAVPKLRAIVRSFGEKLRGK